MKFAQKMKFWPPPFRDPLYKQFIVEKNPSNDEKKIHTKCTYYNNFNHQYFQDAKEDDGSPEYDHNQVEDDGSPENRHDQVENDGSPENGHDQVEDDGSPENGHDHVEDDGSPEYDHDQVEDDGSYDDLLSEFKSFENEESVLQ